jgi:hypothetical protein
MKYYLSKWDAKMALQKKIVAELKIFGIILAGVGILTLTYLINK